MHFCCSVSVYCQSSVSNSTSSVVTVFLRTVDPNRLVETAVGLHLGVAAVAATLRVRFAKTIALGNSLSSQVEGPACSGK